jgi:hypothetical protein
MCSEQTWIVWSYYYVVFVWYTFFASSSSLLENEHEKLLMLLSWNCHILRLHALADSQEKSNNA